MRDITVRTLSVRPSAWAKRGMIPAGKPLIEYAESFLTGTSALRVFVSTLVYSDWPHWSRAAKNALDLVMLGDVLNDSGGTVSSSELPPIRKAPQYVIRAVSDGPWSVQTVWLNATIDTEHEFRVAIEAAQNELRERGLWLATPADLPPISVTVNSAGQYDGMSLGEMLESIKLQREEEARRNA